MIIFTQQLLFSSGWLADLCILLSRSNNAPPQMANSNPLSRTLASAKLTTRHKWVYYELKPTNGNIKVHPSSLLYLIAWVVISSHSGSLILCNQFQEDSLTHMTHPIWLKQVIRPIHLELLTWCNWSEYWFVGGNTLVSSSYNRCPTKRLSSGTVKEGGGGGWVSTKSGAMINVKAW